MGAVASGFFSSGFFSADFFSLSMSASFFFAARAFGDVALAVEVDAAIDQCFLHDGVRAQRIAIVNREVGILAKSIEPARLSIPSWNCRIQRDQVQRFIVREAPNFMLLRLPDQVVAFFFRSSE